MTTPLKLTLEPTEVLREIGGYLVRVWRGTTPQGEPVTALIAVVRAESPAGERELALALAEIPAPEDTSVLRAALSGQSDYVQPYAGIASALDGDPIDVGDASADPDLGPCCICEGTEAVHTLVQLVYKAPIPGHGWGCLVCDLPADGAIGVVCDGCWRAYGGSDLGVHPKLWSDLRFACRGYPGSEGRVPIGELTGLHEHDLSRHDGEGG